MTNNTLVHVHNAQVAQHEPDLVGEVDARRVLRQQAHKHAKHHPAPVADLIRLGPAKNPAGHQRRRRRQREHKAGQAGP